MSNFNMPIVALAALIPLILGFAWYSEFMFGKAWQAATGVTPDPTNKKAMITSMAGLYVMSFIMAFGLIFVTIHQTHLFSILLEEPGFKEQTGEAWNTFMGLMEKYGHNFRTFKHGALHGTIAFVYYALPVIVTTGLFEKRGWKYILITAGFWVINMLLMGGVVCQWGMKAGSGQ